VSNLLGAFGVTARETRLTAMLGFVLSRTSEPLLQLFGFSGRLQEISVEAMDATGRSDIRIVTSRGTGVVEAKLDASDPRPQAQKYWARWRVLLTSRAPGSHVLRGTRYRYVAWSDLGTALERATRTGSPRTRFLCEQLLAHLKESHMVRHHPVEVYAREINERATLNLFLKAWLYFCRYEVRGRLAEAQYFAPHFGRAIAADQFGIRRGISYVAKIQTIRSAASPGEFYQIARHERGARWFRRHRGYLHDAAAHWQWRKNEKRAIVLLGQPYLVFNPPIDKERLQPRRQGFLAKRTFSFDELFAAWNR
jgi:hypothetical protein